MLKFKFCPFCKNDLTTLRLKFLSMKGIKYPRGTKPHHSDIKSRLVCLKCRIVFERLFFNGGFLNITPLNKKWYKIIENEA